MTVKAMSGNVSRDNENTGVNTQNNENKHTAHKTTKTDTQLTRRRKQTQLTKRRKQTQTAKCMASIPFLLSPSALPPPPSGPPPPVQLGAGVLPLPAGQVLRRELRHGRQERPVRAQSGRLQAMALVQAARHGRAREEGRRRLRRLQVGCALGRFRVQMDKYFHVLPLHIPTCLYLYVQPFLALTLLRLQALVRAGEGTSGLPLAAGTPMHQRVLLVHPS